LNNASSVEERLMSLKRPIYGVILITFATLLIYIPAIRGGFIWDDDAFFTKNPLIHASDGLYRFWCTTEAPDYFPLTSTTLWLEWRLWGTNAAGYHVVNLLLHILNSLLIWLALRSLKIPGAWLAAFIFAIHPVNVESVAWITERKNLLPMFFYLVSILLYLKFEENRKTWAYGLSLGTFLLALLSKTSVIMLPLILLGCVWWRRRRIALNDLFRAIPFFLLSLIMGLVTLWFQYHNAIGSTIVRDDSFLSRLAGAGWAVWFYIYKTVFPFNLSFVYPRWQIDTSSLVSFVPILILVSLLIVLFRCRDSWGSPFLFGLGYFVVTLFPVLGFFNIYFMKYSLVADHWQYTSIIGIIALLVGIGVSEYQRWNWPRQVVMIVVAVLVCALCFQSWKETRKFSDTETLWKDTIDKNPGCWMAYNLLGSDLARQGQLRAAINHYLQALRIKPDYPKAHSNIANALIDQGRIDDAIPHFLEALRIKPDSPVVHYNLGTALAERGKLDQAITHFLEALRIKPDYLAARNNLGVVLAQQGKFREAISQFSAVLHVNPDDAQARRNLKHALQLVGKADESKAKPKP